MEERKSLVLRAIIESFISSAEPVGSGYIIETYSFGVSSATIRNDMAWLEREGFIFQPHTSAGRVPTDEGLRKYVDEIDETQVNFRVPATIEKQLESLQKMLARDAQAEAEEKIYYAVSVLARLSDCVSFATLPWRGTAYYLGLAQVLKKPEFCHDATKASSVIEVLEDSENFLAFLKDMNIGKDISVHIGKENILKEMQSCSIVATQYTIGAGHGGVIGILGPKRMNYGFNIAALNAVRNDL